MLKLILQDYLRWQLNKELCSKKRQLQMKQKELNLQLKLMLNKLMRKPQELKDKPFKKKLTRKDLLLMLLNNLLQMKLLELHSLKLMLKLLNQHNQQKQPEQRPNVSLLRLKPV